jgi:hypothetical protein
VLAQDAKAIEETTRAMIAKESFDMRSTPELVMPELAATPTLLSHIRSR